MKGLVSYKFSGEKLEEVEALLNPVQKVLERAGHDPYVILYDSELRTPENIEKFGPKDFIFHVFTKLKEIDFVVVLLVSPEKSEGMILEIGYAMALGIPVVIAQKEGVTNTYLPSLVTSTFTWSDYEDLVLKLKEIDFSALQAKVF